MVRVSPPTVSAASGELSELMFARRDFARFQNGARACRGFLPLPEGPVTRLPGTRFMGFTHNDGLADARLMAFVFRDEDAMLLEWSAGLLRFWRHGTPVVSGGSAYTLASPYNLGRARRLQQLQSADRIYLTDGDLAPRTLSRHALTNWSIAPTVFKGGPFADRNTDPSIEVSASAVTGAVVLTASAPLFGAHHAGTLFQLLEINKAATPYWAADTSVVIGDRMYYDNRCYEVVAFDAQSGRTGSHFPASWDGDTPPATFTDGQVIWGTVAYAPGYQAWQTSEIVNFGERRNRGVYSWEVTGFTTASGANGKTGVNPPIHEEGDWLAEKGGCVWRFIHDGSGIVRISAVASSTQASGTVEKRLPDGLIGTPTYRWAEQAWNTQRGWPRAIGAFGQRHIYGGTPTEPRRLWHGVIGGTTDMTSGPNDDDGFSYTLSAKRRKQGAICAIAEGEDEIFVLTDADEVVGQATDADRAFARETAKYSVVSDHGTADTLPELVDSLPLFLAKDGARLLYLQVDPGTGRLKAENLTAISRHILGGRAVKLVRQTSPLPLVWILLSDGQLACCTFEPAQQVVGFSLHDLGGHITDIEVLPSDDGATQHLWLVVRRTLGGVERHCVERMEHPFVDLDGRAADVTAAWHQFCGLRWTGAVSATIGGFAHLAGQTVTAWTDRGAFTGLVVGNDGGIALPEQVTTAIVGIDMTAAQRFDTLDIVIGQPDGGDDGRLRSHRVSGIRVHRSAGGTFRVVKRRDGKPEGETPAERLFRQFEDPFGPPALRDGVVEMPGHKGWAHQSFLRFTPEPGAPLTVTARTPTLMITDD